MSKINTSEQTNELAAALSQAQVEIRNIVASAENPHFRSSYADLGDIREAIRGPLFKNGLSIFQLPITLENGNPALYSRLMHKSGQFIEAACALIIEKPSMQGLGSAITYMRRYSINAMLGLAETDDDGEAAVGRGVSSGQPQAPSPPPVQPKGTKQAADGRPPALPLSSSGQW